MTQKVPFHKLPFQDGHGLQLYAISASVANPDLDTRSSRRVHKTSWSLLCLLNFSTCVLSDKQKITFSILIAVLLRFLLFHVDFDFGESEELCWLQYTRRTAGNTDHYKPASEWAANAREVTWIRVGGKQNQHNFKHSVSKKLRENILWLEH